MMRVLLVTVLLMMLQPGFAHEVELASGLIFRSDDPVNEQFLAVSFRAVEGATHLPVHLWVQAVSEIRPQDAAPEALYPVVPEGVPATAVPDDPDAWGQDAVPFTWRATITGHYPDAVAPEAFTMLWHRPLRSWTHSSPILAGDRIITVDHPFILLAIDRRDGTVLWQRELSSQVLGLARDRGMPSTDFVKASYRQMGSTPITDGRLIHMRFLNKLVCYDIDGNFRWAQPIAYSMHSVRGGDVGGVIYQGRAVVALSYNHYRAFDRVTGQPLWMTMAEGNNKHTLNWTTIEGREYAVATDGRLLDSHGMVASRHPSFSSYGAVPLVVDGLLYHNTLRNQGRQGAEAWEMLVGVEPVQRFVGAGRHSYITPVYADGLLYDLSSNRMMVYDIASGEVVQDYELARDRSMRGYFYSQPVLVGDRILRVLADRVQQFSTGRDSRHLSDFPHTMPHHTGDQGGGTVPVFSGQRWYFRAADGLYAMTSVSP